MNTIDFIKNFQIELKIQKSSFKEDCLNLIISTKHNQQRSIYRNLFDFKAINSDSIIFDLERCFSDENYPYYEFSKFEIIDFWSNPIRFNIPLEVIFQKDESKIREFHVEEFELENYCRNVFWENNENNIQFNLVSDFNPFEDKIISREMLSKIYRTCFFFNVKDWSDYLEKIICINFPSFKFNKRLSTSKIKRYSKEISNNLILGFEFSTDFKGGLRNHEFHLPYKLKLFLSEKTFETFDFNVNCFDSFYLDMGILGNPYFFTPCYMPFEYFSRELYFFPEIVHNTSFKSRHEIQLEKLDNSNYLVKSPEELGLQLKKCTFRYFNLLSLTTNSYLKYIESCILNSI